MSQDIPLNSSFFISRSFFQKLQYFIDNSHIIIADSHIRREKNESYIYIFNENFLEVIVNLKKIEIILKGVRP